MAPGAALIVKEPLAAVATPVLLPFTATVTFGTGSPLPSFTTPETGFVCAIILNGSTNKSNNIKMLLFLSF